MKSEWQRGMAFTARNDVSVEISSREIFVSMNIEESLGGIHRRGTSGHYVTQHIWSCCSAVFC
jgi:hypothetical protein